MAVRRRNNGWAFVTWVPDGHGGRRQVWRSGFRTKGDATAAERRFLVELEGAANQPAAAVDPGPTVAEFLADWLVASEPTRRLTTSVSYVRMVTQHVVPHLGELRLLELAPGHIRTWHRTLLDKPKAWGGGTLSATTVLYTHRMLRRALQDALRWELILRNPCDAVVPPRGVPVEMRAWTTEEDRRFLAHVDGDRLAAMWRLFLATGMRRGEVAGLRWADVDLDATRLSVRSTRVLVYAEARTVEPKTRRSRRVVALDAGTVAALRRHAQHQAAERERLAEVWEDTGYVFVREDGQPLDPDRISHLFGLHSTGAGVPRIRLHDLRHTAATLALAGGVHPKVVSERLGHSSIAITLDTYSHVLPSMQEEAAAKLGSILDGDVSTG